MRWVCSVLQQHKSINQLKKKKEREDECKKCTQTANQLNNNNKTSLKYFHCYALVYLLL